MGAGRTPSFTLLATPSQEDRTTSCGTWTTSTPSAPGIGPGDPGRGRDLYVATHPSARPYQRTRPGRGRGQRPVPRGREGPAGAVEHPGAAAEQLVALRARVPLGDRPGPLSHRRRVEYRRRVRRPTGWDGDCGVRGR